MKNISFGVWFAVITIIVVAGIVWFIIGSEKAKEDKYKTATPREVAMLCTTDMATQFHIHPVLTINIIGAKQVIPTNIGISPTCMHSIHTHDATGTLHVEAPVQKDFTLADFFAVWEKTFTKDQILDSKVDATHEIVMTVNGEKVDSYENLILKDKDQIVINYQAK